MKITKEQLKGMIKEALFELSEVVEDEYDLLGGDSNITVPELINMLDWPEDKQREIW